MAARDKSVDLVLKIVHEVFKLEHLHLGYWLPDEPPTLEYCKIAQQRFLEKLFGYIPEKTRSILDVGCGLGAGSRMLHAADYAVEALSPDPYQQQIFRNSDFPEIPFHASTFESFGAASRYDLILFSESSQYISLDYLFPGCRKALAPDGGGHVLIADWLVRPGETFLRGHPEERFFEQADRTGFTLQSQEDITEHVTPTLVCLRNFLTDHALPALDVMEEIALERAPIWSRIARLFLGRKLDRMKRFFREELMDRFDPEAFARRLRYSFLLFRLERDRGQ